MTPLFTFAVIADTHLNSVDGQSGSPWPSNAWANDRARWAVAALNADAPAFVLHLGDMVHPVPAQPSYDAAVGRFESIFEDLEAPLYMLPGNHDIGDKPGDWMPAHVVTRKALAKYRKAFGPLWSAFDYQGCRFILHCDPILGSGLPEDEAQWAWLHAQLAGAGGQRIFFLTHYPLFLTDEDEPEHYDNLAFPARDRLRRLLIAHRVEAVFAAHVHTIFHTRLARDKHAPFQHVVPCLSALRLDYSHMFKTPPRTDQEHGRNDADKLGYYLVEVWPDGYRIRLRRTEGKQMVEGKAKPATGLLKGYHQPLSQRSIGVDLRQGWAQALAIPYSGVVDEFRRKYVRNDYILTGLQEAGIRDLRIPIDDLFDPQTRARMQDFGVFGHRFHPFTIDAPSEAAVALLTNTSCVRSIEVVARQDSLAQRLGEWRAALGSADVAVLASRLWSSADFEAKAVSFSHQIGHGFRPDDRLDDRLAESGGVVYRIGPEDNAGAMIQSLPRDYPGELVVYLCLTSRNPADNAQDYCVQRDRVIGALAALRDLPNSRLMLDTFEDHDRGYFPRHGFYDAQFNPRTIARRLSCMEL